MKIKVNWKEWQELISKKQQGEHLVVLFFGGLEAEITMLPFNEVIELEKQVEEGKSNLISVYSFFQLTR